MISGSSCYLDEHSMFHGSLMNIMGTRFDMLLIGKNRDDAGQLWHSIEEELKRLHLMMNRFDPDSEISRINQHAIQHFVPVSEELWDILQDCRSYYQKTFGLFDITQKDLNKVSFNKESRSLRFEQSDFSFDLGGYAKGYAMKQLVNLLKEHKVENCFVDFGNSAIFALGNHPYGDSWKVSIGNPYQDGAVLSEFSLKNRALSTSGNSPSYTGHIVNPLSGTFNISRMLVCVESHDSLDAEVLTTTLMVADKSQKKEILDQFEDTRLKEFYL